MIMKSYDELNLNIDCVSLIVSYLKRHPALIDRHNKGPVMVLIRKHELCGHYDDQQIVFFLLR